MLRWKSKQLFANHNHNNEIELENKKKTCYNCTSASPFHIFLFASIVAVLFSGVFETNTVRNEVFFWWYLMCTEHDVVSFPVAFGILQMDCSAIRTIFLVMFHKCFEAKRPIYRHFIYRYREDQERRWKEANPFFSIL